METKEIIERLKYIRKSLKNGDYPMLSLEALIKELKSEKS
jgi:hypothetical protein